MENILRDRTIIDDNILLYSKTETKSQQEQQHINRVKKWQRKNRKTEDFVFKRYKYERNQLIYGDGDVDAVSEVRRHDMKEEYDMDMQSNKQNELEKYKRELDEKGNHFEIVDFDNEEEDNVEVVKNNDYIGDRIMKQNYIEEIDIKPMQLVDFGEEEEEDNGQQMQTDDIRRDDNRSVSQNESQPKTNTNKNNIQKIDDKNHCLSKPIDSEIDKDYQRFLQKNQQSDSNSILQKQQKQQQISSTKAGGADMIKGVKITKLPNNENIQVEIIDKELFVSSKVPPGIILKCKLKRSSGFMSIMNPEYDLYLENGLKHLVSAKKNAFRNRELFYLSTQMSSYYKPIRTLMSNVSHSTFWLVDEPRLIDRKKISYLDILIDYKPLLGDKKFTREMTVLCPPSLKTYYIGLEYDIPCIDFYWFQKNITLKLHYRPKSILIENAENSEKVPSQKDFDLIDSQDEDLQEKENVQIVLNRKKLQAAGMMKNKHTKAAVNNIITSAKQQQHSRQSLRKNTKNNNNLQEIYGRQSKYLYLKMQKSSQNIFDIEIQHPLTPLQAMAIVLTRFDVQLK